MEASLKWSQLLLLNWNFYARATPFFSLSSINSLFENGRVDWEERREEADGALMEFLWFAFFCLLAERVMGAAAPMAPPKRRQARRANQMEGLKGEAHNKWMNKWKELLKWKKWMKAIVEFMNEWSCVLSSWAAELSLGGLRAAASRRQPAQRED